MSNERIDIESMEARMRLWAIGDVSDEDLALELDYIVPELKKMYEREDALVSAIKELCDSEDSTGCSGDLTVVSLDPMLKLYELTSE